MRLTWDPEAAAWVGDVSPAGPAGTAATTVAGVWVEFDRVDSGRIVSIVIPPHESVRTLLTDAWSALEPAAGAVETSVDVSFGDTPLWLARRELARAAELAEDATRLEADGDRNAAAIALAELAEVLHDLDDLAPKPATAPLERLLGLMHGDPPLIYEDGQERYVALAARILRWAPDSLRSGLEALRHPDAMTRTVRVPAPEPVFAGEEWSARAVAERNAPADLLSRMWEANDLGRRALRIEQSESGNAADAWRRCATAWLKLGETGRAAIALDRAADAEARQGGGAEEDRQHAIEIGPLWVLPFLDGQTGRPHQPLWSLAPDLPTTPADPDDPLPDGRMGSLSGGSHDPPAATTPAAGPSALVISYAFDDRDYVAQLGTALRAAGIAVWYDRELEAGRRWNREVEARIDTCAALVVVMSEAATASSRVDAEVSRAQARGRPVRPILRSGHGLPRLANIRCETVRPGQILPSGSFLDRLRADLAAADAPLPTRAARLLGRGFPSRNPHFRGRDSALQEIEARLRAEQSVTVRARNGAAGVGMSALAAEYAYTHRAEYDVVAWIDAERPELVADQLAALALQLGVASRTASPTAQDAITALRGAVRRSLIVLDNAERLDDLRPWLGHGTGHTIVTSRRSDWQLARVDVGRMSREDGMTLLQQRASTVDDSAAGAIVDLLGNLPLALHQAAGHLATTGVPAEEYLGALRAWSDALRAKDYAPGGTEHAVAAVWAVGRPILRQASPAAEELLRLCSFLGTAPIPLELYSEHARALPVALKDVAADELRFGHVVNDLVARSLVHYGTDGVSVHRLLAAAVDRSLSGLERTAAAATVRDLLSRHLPGESGRPERGPRNVSVWHALLPHVLNVANHPDPGHGDRGAALVARAEKYLRTHSDPATGPPHGLNPALGATERNRLVGPPNEPGGPTDPDGRGSDGPPDPNRRR